MSRSNEPFPLSARRRSRLPRMRVFALALAPVAAILFQVYVPLFLEPASYLSVPLLVTVYFAVMQRDPVIGLLFGACIGLVEDSLSHQPLGMFGISKTLVGYAAASIGMRFDVAHPMIRFGLGFLFFLFHQACYWALGTALVGLDAGAGVPMVLLLGLVNAAAAVPLFYFFDKLRGD